MTIIKINYYAHSILNSRYYLAYKLFILFFIYVLIYNKDIVFCMNDNPDIVEIPPVAEAKETHRPSHQVLALKKEIIDFVGPQLNLLERIQEQDQQITELKTQINDILSFYQQRELGFVKRERKHFESIQDYNNLFNEIMDSPCITDKQQILNMLAKLPITWDYRPKSAK